MYRISSDKLKEECGVFGIYSKSIEDISQRIYFGLISLQHRGQESAGIAVCKDKRMNYYKEMGLVREVFNEKILKRLEGNIGIGHVRYSTTGDSHVINAQPLVVQYIGGSIALAHNGNLINAPKIRKEMEKQGYIFQTSIDTEVIATLIAKNYSYGLEESLIRTMKSIKGAYALNLIYEDKLIGVRDPNGLRPLAIGKLDDGYVLSSESCAFNVIGAEYIRDVEPGEIVIIDDNGINSITFSNEKKKALCSFEFVYFSRPDSILDGRSVYKSRIEAGKILSKEAPVEADLIMSVPDSGTLAAIGYSEESGIPFREGLIKNKYLGRSFIEPSQDMRELLVKLKLSVLRENVEGKRIILVDDSIVRGTTSKKIISMLKKAGAKEIHVRVSSPPVKYSCYFGIDTPERKHLIASEYSLEEIRQRIACDSIAFLSEEGLIKSIGLKDNICTACFKGDYPMEVPDTLCKFSMEK
ncbi:amidophosphoribosyltransferase [Clostridium sp. D2Q-11]|uniref:Amidophosphoribosyltransferase n=1 Tax=Anaeromonas frigoriresistens TaxID=2683708 RepID=A0A942Z999_9FIRM|nr:amidophosphoribosyltransferase [Anaeromonas frigoriresistens]MBS4538899.1 amidophosphoribosyltransferase [Anaeromonas frigoriresistens]